MCAPLDTNMQNCPRQLAMQFCALCLYVRCRRSNQIKNNKKNIQAFFLTKEKRIFISFLFIITVKQFSFTLFLGKDLSQL